MSDRGPSCLSERGWGSEMGVPIYLLHMKKISAIGLLELLLFRKNNWRGAFMRILNSSHKTTPPGLKNFKFHRGYLFQSKSIPHNLM